MVHDFIGGFYKEIWKCVFKRQQGGGSFMVWARISNNGTIFTVEINENLGFKYYCEVLEEEGLQQTTNLFGAGWKFVHRSVGVTVQSAWEADLMQTTSNAY